MDAEVEYREHDIVHSLDHDDALFERFLEAQGKTREDFTAELRENAEKSVRAQFILDAVAEKTDVQIGDSELTEYLVRQAAQYQMAPQEFANQLMQSGNLPMLVADIRRNKALASPAGERHDHRRVGQRRRPGCPVGVRRRCRRDRGTAG